MFYSILRRFVKFGLNWFVSDWQLKDMELTKLERPTLIVANHPNSFFDGIILTVFSEKTTRFLTRGDIFKEKWLVWLLRGLYLVPIYKQSDDSDYEIRNAFTYDECARYLSSSENILLFPEGVSRNTYRVAPFMQGGFSSLIHRAIRMDIPIQVQAFSINYSSFDHLPKSISINALPPIDCTDYLVDSKVDTAQISHKISEGIKAELPGGPSLPSEGYLKDRSWMEWPAKLGYYSHNWFYQLVKKRVKKKTDGTIFYDSLMFTILLFTYPLVILLLSLIIGNLIGFWTGVFFFILMPFLSYCWVQYEPIKIGDLQEIPKVNHFEKAVK